MLSQALFSLRAVDAQPGLNGFKGTNLAATRSMNQSGALSEAGGLLGDALGPPPPPVAAPVTLTGCLLRLMPMCSMLFVTFFGNKVSTVVRVISVFWTSIAPTIVPVIKQMVADGNLTVATFMALGGSLYAGFLGSFAAVKSKGFGIMVQGMALAYILGSVLQGYVIAAVVEKHPQAEQFTDWIAMIFTLGLGLTIGKLALEFEDILSVAATAAIGSYSLLQVVVSLGFDATKDLSLFSALNGTFGCNEHGWACDTVLSLITAIGSMGTFNQVMMSRVMKKMLNDPNYCGSNSYERMLVKVNSMFAVLFALNDVAKSEGKHQTKNEMEDIKKQKDLIYLQLMTVGSCIAQMVLSCSLFSSIAEGFALGCFPLSQKILLYFALALGGVGAFSMGLTYFLVRTHMLPTEERPRRNGCVSI